MDSVTQPRNRSDIPLQSQTYRCFRWCRALNRGGLCSLRLGGRGANDNNICIDTFLFPAERIGWCGNRDPGLPQRDCSLVTPLRRPGAVVVVIILGAFGGTFRETESVVVAPGTQILELKHLYLVRGISISVEFKIGNGLPFESDFL